MVINENWVDWKNNLKSKKNAETGVELVQQEFELKILKKNTKKFHTYQLNFKNHFITLWQLNWRALCSHEVKKIWCFKTV